MRRGRAGRRSDDRRGGKVCAENGRWFEDRDREGALRWSRADGRGWGGSAGLLLLLGNAGHLPGDGHIRLWHDERGRRRRKAEPLGSAHALRLGLEQELALLLRVELDELLHLLLEDQREAWVGVLCERRLDLVTLTLMTDDMARKVRRHPLAAPAEEADPVSALVLPEKLQAILRGSFVREIRNEGNAAQML